MILMSRDEPGVMLQPPAKPKPPEVVAPRQRPILGEAAYHGIAGEIALASDTISEADPAAVLAHLMAFAGCAVGNTPHWSVNGTRHKCNIFYVIVGPTGNGKKGTALGIAKSIMYAADKTLCDREVSGIASGEALVDEIRDPVIKGLNKDGFPNVIDEGESDKRLMIVEQEWAQVLAVASRQGAVLSEMLRKAWDGGDLRITRRNNKARAY